MVGVWDADDFGVWDLSLKRFGLSFNATFVGSFHGGADFGFVFHGVSEVVGVGKDGKDRNTLDGVVALHTFSDGENRRRWSGRMAC